MKQENNTHCVVYDSEIGVWHTNPMPENEAREYAFRDRIEIKGKCIIMVMTHKEAMLHKLCYKLDKHKEHLKSEQQTIKEYEEEIEKVKFLP